MAANDTTNKSDNVVDSNKKSNTTKDANWRWKPGEFQAIIESRKLVTSKSNLEWASRGEGLARIDPLSTKPELKYVNFFHDAYVTGFTPNRQLHDTTEFKGVGENVQTQSNPSTRTANPIVDFEATKRFENYPKIELSDLPSPLEILHKDGLTNRSPLRKEGDPDYTYSPSPLESMYDRGLKVGDRLSYKRGGQRLGFRHPFIIRDIGNQWGIDKIPLPDSKDTSLKNILTIGMNAIDEIGGVVLGRQPTTFIDRYVADITRTGKFLASVEGIGFLLKQKVFYGRNTFDKTASLKFGLLDLKSGLGDMLQTSSRLILDPQRYNPLSLMSIPGAFQIPSVAPFSIKEMLKDAKIGVARYIRDEALKAAMPVIGEVVGAAGQSIGKLLKKKSKELTPKPIQDKIEENAPAAKEAADKLSSWGKIASKAYGTVSKALTTKLGLSVDFANVGVDKVNLIKYGKTETDENESYESLDFIPFKFYDINSEKHIVFRAILSGISDTFTPSYAEEKYVGRPDKVYVYQGTDRTISFTFDIYPKSDKELVTLWEKMNYLAGLTYPAWEKSRGGGRGMVAPFCKLTIGQMFKDTPGYISALTYTVQDNGTWETTFAKLPKYIQASCTFIYIGKRLPSSTQKHYELPWVAQKNYVTELSDTFLAMMDNVDIDVGTLLKQSPDSLGKWAEKN